MAIDELLSQRFRNHLAGSGGISEKKMIGGHCFFLNGNMIGGADRPKNGRARYMFRVGKEKEDAALARPGACRVVLGGRRMGGLVYVDAQCCGDAELAGWISLAEAFAQSLPPK